MFTLRDQGTSSRVNLVRLRLIDGCCVAVSAKMAEKRAILDSYIGSLPLPPPLPQLPRFELPPPDYPQRAQLAEARAQRDAAISCIDRRAAELRASQAQRQLAEARAQLRAQTKFSYFSHIFQLFIVVLLCLILIKLGCLSFVVSFTPNSPLALGPA